MRVKLPDSLGVVSRAKVRVHPRWKFRPLRFPGRVVAHRRQNLPIPVPRDKAIEHLGNPRQREAMTSKAVTAISPKATMAAVVPTRPRRRNGERGGCPSAEDVRCRARETVDLRFRPTAALPIACPASSVKHCPRANASAQIRIPFGIAVLRNAYPSVSRGFAAQKLTATV